MGVAPNGTGGEYARLKLKKNKRHRLRLFNTSADNTFVVSIVGHNMTVIEADFVPVQPYLARQLCLTVGQRYDVMIKADQEVDNYWLNATLSSTSLCGVSLNPHPTAIVSYEGADESRLPTNIGLPAIEQFCEDDITPKPLTLRTAPRADFTNTKVDTLAVTLDVKGVNKGISKVLWAVDGSAIDVQWEKPTLEYVVEGNITFPRQANLIKLPEAAKVWSLEPLTMHHRACPCIDDLELTCETTVLLGDPEQLSLAASHASPREFLFRILLPCSRSCTSTLPELTPIIHRATTS